MVDAPCVVKVVPLNEEPDNYDDLMAVTFHEGSNESPKILPLIRVNCGTILCVRAPPSSDNASDTSSVDLSSRRWHVCYENHCIPENRASTSLTPNLQSSNEQNPPTHLIGPLPDGTPLKTASLP